MENSLYDVEQNPKPTAPPAPPQPSQLYPEINRSYTCNSQQFRLVEIQKMRTDLEGKIKCKEMKCKKYKRQMKGLDVASGLFSTVSVLTGSSAAVSAMPVITIPLAVPMGIISAVTGVSSGIILAVSRNRRKKLVAQTNYLIDEKAVYNSIIGYISRAIEDRLISPDEFEHIQKLYLTVGSNKNQPIDDLSNLVTEINKILMAHKK